MTTINLYQNQEEGEKRAASRGVNSGFFFSMGILIATLGVLFGLKYYNPVMEAKNEALAKNINDENGKLVGLKNLEQIIDMQKRLGQIRGNLQIRDGKVAKTDMTQVLDRLGLEMNKGVVVASYTYSGDKITVIFEANNFNDVSRQILNFKKSEFFKDVNLTNISRGEKAISSSVEMVVKNI